MKQSKISLLAKLSLLGATLIWGSSFIMVKDVVETVPTFFLLAIRFLLAGAVLSLIFWKRLKTADWRYVWNGAALGGLLLGAYAFQTFGVARTTPGKNAFLTAVYCVIVPFLFWVTDKRRPDRYQAAAAVLCLAGIGMVSLTDHFTVGAGDALTLCGGLFFAAHIVAVAKFGRGRDPILLTVFQFYFSGLCSLVLTLTTETRTAVVWDWAMVSTVGYLALFCTAAGLLMQNFGQKYTHPAAASILLSLESVFGTAFSVIFYKEQLTGKIAAGFGIIFLSVILSETKLSFLKSKRVRSDEHSESTIVKLLK